MKKKDLPSLEEICGTEEKRILHGMTDMYYILLEKQLEKTSTKKVTSSELEEILKEIITNVGLIKSRVEETLESIKELSREQLERVARYNYEDKVPCCIPNLKALKLATELFLDDVLTTEIALDEISEDIDLSFDYSQLED